MAGSEQVDQTTRRLAPRLLAPSRLWRMAVAHPIWAAFLLALLARAVLVLVIFQRLGGTIFYDDIDYDRMTTHWVEGPPLVEVDGELRWDDEAFFRATWMFTYPVAFAKLLFGASPVVGQLVVALAGALAAALTTRLATEVVSRGWALMAGAVIALYPSQIFWSSLIMKDAMVWALAAGISLLAAIALRDDRRSRWLWLAGAVALIWMLNGARFHTSMIAGWALFGAALVIPGRDRLLRIATCLAVAVLLPAILGHGLGGIDLVRAREFSHWRALNAYDAKTAVVAPVLTPAVSDQRAASFDEAADEAERLARLAAQQVGSGGFAARRAERADMLRLRAIQARLAAEEAAAEAARVAAAASPVLDKAFGEGEALEDGTTGNLRYLPRGVALMLFKPYPWVSTTNSNVGLARLEHVVWYPLLALSAIGLLSLWRRRRVLAVPALITAGTLLAMALTEGNFGTAYRHRGELVWFVALLAAVGAERVVALIRRRRAEGAVDESALADEPGAAVLVDAL